MRWTFDDKADLGDLGNLSALVTAECTVERARSPEEGFDSVNVRLSRFEVYIPTYDGHSNTWGTKLVDLTGVLLGPGGLMLRQRIETRIEEKHEREIMDHLNTWPTPDRLEVGG